MTVDMAELEQPVAVIVYLIEAVPGASPVTTPVPETTVAMEVFIRALVDCVRIHADLRHRLHSERVQDPVCSGYYSEFSLVISSVLLPQLIFSAGC